MNRPKPPEDPRSTEELFAHALREQRHSEDPEWAGDAMSALQWRATAEVFQTAQQWCQSADPVERSVAAYVLGQLGCREKAFHGEAVALLIPLLSDEDPLVMEAAGVALGHRQEATALPHLLALIHHPEWKVRDGARFGLSGCPNDPRAIAGLIELSRDTHALIRDWATFSLGTLTDTDTPELRAALLARTEDEDDETRNEAFVGLANRRDERIIQPLIRELSGPYHGTWAAEAAGNLGLPVFYEYLLPLRTFIEEQNPWFLDHYEEALTACRPPENA